MSLRKTATILALGWIAWGALVDMRGLPVVYQVLVVTILTGIAIFVDEGKK